MQGAAMFVQERCHQVQRDGVAVIHVPQNSHQPNQQQQVLSSSHP